MRPSFNGAPPDMSRINLRARTLNKRPRVSLGMSGVSEVSCIEGSLLVDQSPKGTLKFQVFSFLRLVCGIYFKCVQLLYVDNAKSFKGSGCMILHDLLNIK